MTKISKIMAGIAVVLTIATLITWQATGGDYYTKYQVVEQVEVEFDENDPFAGTGLFDDDDKQTETVTRDEFHLGLLPTPRTLFDKHIVSVATIVSPPWALAIGLILVGWMRNRKNQKR